MGANAQTSVPAFTSGQVLTASQVTQINTGIPVFASSTERDAAFGGAGEKALAEGQMAYLEDTNETQVYDGSAWAAVGGGGAILQVVNATHSTQVLVSSTTPGATGLTASITPSATSSKVLVIITNPMRIWNENNSTVSSGRATSKLYRDGSEVHDFGAFRYYDNEVKQRDMEWNGTLTFMDSPATTSSVSYEQYIVTDTTNQSAYSCFNNYTASITLMEVAG